LPQTLASWKRTNDILDRERRTAWTSAAESRRPRRTIRPTRTSTFDELRQIGEFAATQHVIAVGIEPTEQRLQFTLRGTTDRAQWPAPAGTRFTFGSLAELPADSSLEALTDFTRAVTLAGSLIIATCFGARSIAGPTPTLWFAIAFRASLALRARPAIAVSVAILFATACAISLLRVVSVIVVPVIAQFPHAHSELIESLAQFFPHGGAFFFIEPAITVSIEDPQNAFSRNRTACQIAVIAFTRLLSKCQCRQCQHAGNHQLHHRFEREHEINLA
jgi:hypothetical protein